MKWTRNLSASKRCANDDDRGGNEDRKSTRLNSSHGYISYAVFCLKKQSFAKREPPSATGARKNPRRFSSTRVTGSSPCSRERRKLRRSCFLLSARRLTFSIIPFAS